MAIIEWHEDVWQLFNDHVDYARYEFGEKTANKWLHEMATIDKWLRQFPESYTPEPLLKDRDKRYRFCRLLKRFKIIYYYEPESDTVHIVDLWDTLQNPATLIQRID
jgi:plasmid stabilization system protein ParE